LLSMSHVGSADREGAVCLPSTGHICVRRDTQLKNSKDIILGLLVWASTVFSGGSGSSFVAVEIGKARTPAR